MAPIKKSRSVGKRFMNYTEVSLDKDDGNSNKSRQRKRKLSDMLGSQWSKEELERFYEAFRKYGNDWKKVAGVVRNRSVEMVEALYNMNKAYLTLPEGSASVAGLIAMMIDHYNVLEGSDSDRESNDASRLSRKTDTQKRGRGKVQSNASQDLLLSPSIASKNVGSLSLFKRRHSDGCTVRKRTPRFPVTYSSRNDGNDNYVSPNKRGQKLELDDDVEHVVALALTQASQRGRSPQVSRSPFRTDHMKSSPFQSWLSQSEMGRARPHGPAIEEDCLEGSLGSRGAKNGDYARNTSALTDKGVGIADIYQKGKKVYRRKGNVEDIRINQFDDGWEACSGTEEGLNVSDVKGGVDIEVTNSKIEHSSSLGKRKRNKKLFFGDETSALDALQTLADLSLMMPASAVESAKPDVPWAPKLTLEDRPIMSTESADDINVGVALSTALLLPSDLEQNAGYSEYENYALMLQHSVQAIQHAHSFSMQSFENWQRVVDLKREVSALKKDSKFLESKMKKLEDQAEAATKAQQMAEEKAESAEAIRKVAEAEKKVFKSKMVQAEEELQEALATKKAEIKEVDEKAYAQGMADVTEEYKLQVRQACNRGFSLGWMALAKKLNIPDDSPLRKAEAIPLPFPPLPPPSQAEDEFESESEAEDEDKDDGDALVRKPKDANETQSFPQDDQILDLTHEEDEEVIKEATPEQASSDVPLAEKSLDETLAEIDAEIEAEKIAEEVPPESSEVPAPLAVNAEES